MHVIPVIYLYWQFQGFVDSNYGRILISQHIENVSHYPSQIHKTTVKIKVKGYHTLYISRQRMKFISSSLHSYSCFLIGGSITPIGRKIRSPSLITSLAPTFQNLTLPLRLIHWKLFNKDLKATHQRLPVSTGNRKHQRCRLHCLF